MDRIDLSIISINLWHQKNLLFFMQHSNSIANKCSSTSKKKLNWKDMTWLFICVYSHRQQIWKRRPHLIWVFITNVCRYTIELTIFVCRCRPIHCWHIVWRRQALSWHFQLSENRLTISESGDHVNISLLLHIIVISMKYSAIGIIFLFTDWRIDSLISCVTSCTSSNSCDIESGWM